MKTVVSIRIAAPADRWDCVQLSRSSAPNKALTNEKARRIGRAFSLQRVPDNDLLSHGSSVLSSACRRFTVLFGMGRGGTSGLWSSGIAGIRGQVTGNSSVGDDSGRALSAVALRGRR